MTVAAARALRDGNVCFVGIGLPSTAANLARRTHAPGARARLRVGHDRRQADALPLSIGDGELAETADAVVGVPEIFNYWLQPGRIDVGFLGAAQIDRFAQHQHDRDRRRLRRPEGPAARRRRRARDRRVLPRGDRDACARRRARSSSGSTSSPPSATATARRPGAARPARPRPGAVITDLGVLEPDPETCELMLTALHPGVTVEEARAATGWELRVSDDLGATPAPTATSWLRCASWRRPRADAARWQAPVAYLGVQAWATALLAW